MGKTSNDEEIGRMVHVPGTLVSGCASIAPMIGAAARDENGHHCVGIRRRLEIPNLSMGITTSHRNDMGPVGTPLSVTILKHRGMINPIR